MWIRIIFLILLSLGTAVFSIEYNRYEVIGENLLQNPQFHNKFLGWQVQNRDSASIQEGILTLSNATSVNHSSVSAMQTVAVPAGQHLLFLSCEARATNVIPGTKRWETARVLIAPLTSDGKYRHDVPHMLASLHGSTPWTKFEHVFRVPEENTTVSVVVQLLNASGTLEVRSLSLRSAIENSTNTTWRHVLMLVWLIMGLWIIWPLLRTAHHNIGRTWILVIASMILVGILMPASMKEAMTPSWVLPERETTAPFRADLLEATDPFRFDLLPTELNIYKLAHFLLFALIGYLLISCRPYTLPIKAQIGIIGLFALATESMQVLASGRAGNLSDVIIDLSGVCCGLVAAAAIQNYYFSKSR